MIDKTAFDGCTSPEDAIKALGESGMKTVHIGIFDIDTVFREKAVGVAKAQRMIAEGYGFSDVLFEWDSAEATYAGGSFADEPAAIDPASGRVYPFAPDSAIFLSDLTGRHAPMSPRSIAKAQIDRAAAMGYGIRVGFEYEFFLFEETPESLRAKGYRDLRCAAVGNRPYSLVTVALEEAFLSSLFDILALAGIDTDSYHSELGPGCLETPLAAREGLRAADDAALFKTLTKAHALRCGRMACFMAKWSNQWPGQSGHMHISLYELASGKPVFAGDGPGGALNDPLRWFLGGMLRHLPELLVMTAHTVNAYRRMVPGAWAPTHASWGRENRSCAARVITSPAADTRIEYRVPAADANPYLALAACLASGLDGVEKRTDPTAMSGEDAYLDSVSPEHAFPRDLMEAADRWRASAAARDLFGDTFVDWFARTRQWECDVFRGHVSDLDVRRYFEVM
jgi:glutamine synthetase